MSSCFDVVSERLEQPSNQRLAAPARRDGDYGGPVERPVRQFLAFLAPAAHGSPEDARHGNAEKRGRDVWPIVDVLIERAFSCRLRSPSDEAYGIDVEQQRR